MTVDNIYPFTWSIYSIYPDTSIYKSYNYYYYYSYYYISIINISTVKSPIQ